MPASPIIGAPFIRQPLFSGPCISKMKSLCNRSSQQVTESRQDSFERTSIIRNPLDVASSRTSSLEYEIFPLLEQYKDDPGVLPETEQERYKVTIRGNTLFRTDNTPFLPRSGQFRYIWDANGQLFMEDANNKTDITSHASFIGDNPVRCAGRMLVRFSGDGTAQVTSIDNESGHYHPSKEALAKMVTWMEEQGIKVHKKAYVSNGKIVFF
jgi:hypothetical protein